MQSQRLLKELFLVSEYVWFFMPFRPLSISYCDGIQFFQGKKRLFPYLISVFFSTQLTRITFGRAACQEQMETCAKFALETARWKELECPADALPVTMNTTMAIWEHSGNTFFQSQKHGAIAKIGLLFCWWFSMGVFPFVKQLAVLTFGSMYFA